MQQAPSARLCRRSFLAAAALGLMIVARAPLDGAPTTLEAASSTGVPAFDPADPRASFAAMAEYLARDGGRWRGDNPNHDPDNRKSPPAFGLWFEQSLGGRVLELQIVLHYADSDVISSRGSFVWHPGLGELSYRMVGRNGRVTEGATSFPDSATFQTIATLHQPDGEASVHRDDNVLLSDSVHRNETFAKDEDGSWISRGVYEWRRVPNAASR